MLKQKYSTGITAKGPQACLQRLPGGEDLGICRQAAVRLRAAVNRAAAVPMMPHNHRAPKVRLRSKRAVEWQAAVLVVGKSAHTQIVSGEPQSTASLPHPWSKHLPKTAYAGGGVPSAWQSGLM